MGSSSRSQGRPGNRPAGGRLGKSRERMNKNCIEGRAGEASWHHTAKPSDPVRTVNAAAVRRRTALLPREIPGRKCPGKSAEAIVPGSEPDTQRPEDSMPGRAEPTSEHPTAGRTPEPMTPEWARHPVSAVLMGSMGCTVRGPRITQCVRRQLRAHCRNRRTRTRMSGGVGAGADPHGSVPATRFASIIRDLSSDRDGDGGERPKRSKLNPP